MIKFDAKDWDIKKVNLNQDIIVIDNLFPDWFVRYVDNIIFDADAWRFGHRSYDTGDEVPAFAQRIYPPNAVHSGDSIFPMIYQAVTYGMDDQLNLGEVIVNGQQFYHNTILHTDCDDNGLTLIYYVNNEWKEEWGGVTTVLEDDIIPKPGRVCLFPGRFMHKGAPPNDCYKGLRATIAYKIGRT